MRKFFLAFALVCVSMQLSAQQTVNSGNVGDFNSLSVSGNMNVELILSDQNRLDIQLFDSDVSKLRWGVENNKLSVSLRTSLTNSKARAEVKIYYKAIDELTVSGAQVTSQEVITSDMMDIKVINKGGLIVELKCMDLNVSATGISIVQLKGESKYVTAHAADRSRLELPALEAVSVIATANTTAEVYVNAIERLEATAKAGSTIFYRGNPVILRALTSKILKFGATVHGVE